MRISYTKMLKALTEQTLKTERGAREVAVKEWPYWHRNVKLSEFLDTGSLMMSLESMVEGVRCIFRFLFDVVSVLLLLIAYPLLPILYPIGYVLFLPVVALLLPFNALRMCWRFEKIVKGGHPNDFVKSFLKEGK